MNTERTSSSARRFFASFSQKPRLFFVWLAAALLLVSLAATAVQAGLKPAPYRGSTGAVLALAAQLRTAQLRAASSSGHTPDGRTLASRKMMHAGALVRAQAAAAASVVPISGGVQTYDVNNPPPAFRPLIGYDNGAGVAGNNSQNPPLYVNSLAPTNLFPVWSSDETFLIFSSNRTALGAVATDGRFHLWAISVNGGQAFQITTSAGPANGGEFFPALSRNNLTIAFTSDAASSGTQNLYAFAFSYSALISSASPVGLSATTANPTPPAPLTLRAPTEAGSAAVTGFDQVQRPTFSPNDDQLLIFSAHAVSGTNGNHSHLYFLYRSSGGFDSNNNISYPGKLTDGPSDDTDPAYAPDGTYIAFASTANGSGFTRNPSNAFGPGNPSDIQDPKNSQSLSSGAIGSRSLFLISGGSSATGVPFGTVPGSLGVSGGRVSLGSPGGFDDYGPAWSSFANQNQYTNPTSGLAYLAFSRSSSPAAAHDVYYFQAATGVSQPSNETLVPESAAGGSNASIKLNTDDTTNVYDDSYPTWSPFLSIFSIAYTSNRTVTYNDPTSGVPVEVAKSVAQTGTVTNTQGSAAGYSVGANYTGLLVSQVLNLDPPTLLRFSTNEVVHVQAAAANPVNGTPNKLAATGGQSVALTIRLSDREAGIADTGGPGGGPRVYIQIKDPDGKYKDSQNAEHKVFAKDFQYNGQPNQPLNDVTSGRVNAAVGTGFPNYESLASQFDSGSLNKYTYPSYGTPRQTTPVIAQRVFPRGAHGGHYFAPDTNNPDLTYIFVGKGANGTTNPSGVGSTDPAQFIPQGPEYEAQVVNPQFANGDTVPDNPNITIANPAGNIGDYVSPYWLAGVDDQGAFSGGTYSANTGASALPSVSQSLITPNGSVGIFSYVVTNGTTQTDRPTAGYVTGDGASTTYPAEWLQLVRVPADQQDNNGGVLYTVTWPTPNSGSDFYVDVIAYDNAVFPNVPNSAYTGKKTNWRIYDNVGGFSTNSSVGGNDILLVSDYALGQKFAATTFGGRNLNLNLVPKIFGTESYLSDVDVNILPDSEFAGIPTSPASYIFQPAIQVFGDFSPGLTIFGNYGIVSQNGLGVRSYIDPNIDDNTRFNGEPNVLSQAYSIWRILSRGPVPTSLLNSYLPTPVSQPAIIDAGDPNYKNIAAATILDAPRCVIWLSPYTGDVLADPGTIDDPGNVGVGNTTNPRQSTTSILTNFVKSGGRLCVTGQDVGSTLTQGGSVDNAPSTTAGSPNFLPDVLNAILTSNGSGVNVLAATANRITGSPFYDATDAAANGRYLTSAGLIQGPYLYVFPNFAYQDNLVLGNADYGDSSLSQVPAITLPGGASIQGQSDVIKAVNTGTVTAMTYGPSGGGAMVYHDDPYKAGNTGTLPDGGTGSRVVYAAFGLEGLSQDYYSSASPNPSATPILPNPLAPDEIIPHVAPRNPRSEILHNIVSFLRTGRVSGTITQTAGTGQGGGLGIDGVTVYLRPTGGAPSSRVAFSALTANGGRFTIAGVEPGTYTLVAIKPGFQRAVSNTGVSFTVEGDVTKTGATLTLTPQQPGNIAGAVKDTVGKLIDGATITFTSQDGSVVRTATSATGSVSGSTTENYFLQTVPVTTYTATATGPTNPAGQPEYAAAKAPDGPAKTGDPDYSTGVPVQPNTTTQPVNFTLTPLPATISGTVTSSAGGAPISGATVTPTDSAGKAVGTPAVTKADGTYTITGLPVATTPTTYSITAAAPGFAASAAITETVYLGSIITAQNFSLVPVVPASIFGKVTDSSQNAPGSPPLAGVTITVTNSTGGVVATVPATVTTQIGTVIGPDGKPSNYSAALSPGTYTVTASKGSYDSKTSAVVTVAQATPVRVDLTLVSSIGTLGGLVTGQNGTAPIGGATVTATLVGGTGTAASVSFTTVATATPGPDGAPVNYTGPLSKGTYTVTVTQGNRTTAAKTVFVVGGAFNRADFTGTTGLPALHTFASGFQFVSTPYDYSSIGFDGLFGAKNTALAGTTPNGNRSGVAVWDPLVGAYALDPTAPADALRLGVGYWVYLKNAQLVTLQGATPTTPTVRVSLGKGWNQIGVPNPAGIAVQNLAFDNGAGGTISFSAASSSQYNLVTYPLYSYAAGGYQVVSTTGTLLPWNAYWLYVNAPAVLVIPTR